MRGSACLRGHGAGDRACTIFHKNELLVKCAVLKVCESVVSVVTYDLPDEMLEYRRGRKLLNSSQSPGHEAIFWGSGTIIECCDASDGDSTYSATILTAANLFERTNDLKPDDVKVDVYLADGQQVEAEVKCCDFHFNLAVLRIRSNSILPVAKLRCLDDVLPIDVSELLQLQERHSFQLRPQSESTKIIPGELVISVGRIYINEFSLAITPAYFSEKQSHDDDDGCRELYGAYCCRSIDAYGGPVINCRGEVIGMRFHSGEYIPFLPSNVVMLWWNHFRKFGEFRRPWVGMDVCNLHEAGIDVLQKFPNIATGVMVTKILKNSPAKCARIRLHDVIVQCDGISVGSILEFFEKIWHKTGESIELGILRVGASKSRPLKRTMTIGEATPDKFYGWSLPVWDWNPAWALGYMDESDVDDDDDENDDDDDDDDDDDGGGGGGGDDEMIDD